MKKSFYLVKKLFLFLFCSLLFCCCNPNNLAPAATSIINDVGVANAEELLLEIEITSSNNPDRYIVLDSIKNITVQVNNEIWGVFNYIKDNKSKFNDLLEIDNFSTTGEGPFSHKLVLDYLTTAVEYESAGQYADFISGFLQSGDFFCTIETFSVFDNLENEMEIYPLTDFIITIEEGEQSVYIGKIQIQL